MEPDVGIGLTWWISYLFSVVTKKAQSPPRVQEASCAQKVLQGSHIGLEI